MIDKLTNILPESLQTPIIVAALVVVASILIALIVRLWLFRLIFRLTKHTQSETDDKIILLLRGPVAITIVLSSIAWSLTMLDLGDRLSFVLPALITTAAIFIWGSAIMRLGVIFLEVMSRHQHKVSWIHPKTLPMLQMTWKIVIGGAFVYFLLLAWRINPTSWLASAGVVGIAIGFAAKDSLANLLAGIFIIADAPYKVGDFVVIDNVLRGQVTDIGIRSSRLLTRDDVEVTVPNAIIANGTIINETGGWHEKMRVRVKVAAAYGSDVDQVRDVLLACTKDVTHVVQNPEPRVRFRELGASGLVFELLVWIEEPVFRGRVLDALYTIVYKAFQAEGIEIPYSKQDLYVKEMPKFLDK